MKFSLNLIILKGKLEHIWNDKWLKLLRIQRIWFNGILWDVFVFCGKFGEEKLKILKSSPDFDNENSHKN